MTRHRVWRTEPIRRLSGTIRSAKQQPGAQWSAGHPLFAVVPYGSGPRDRIRLCGFCKLGVVKSQEKEHRKSEERADGGCLPEAAAKQEQEFERADRELRGHLLTHLILQYNYNPPKINAQNVSEHTITVLTLPYGTHKVCFGVSTATDTPTWRLFVFPLILDHNCQRSLINPAQGGEARATLSGPSPGGRRARCSIGALGAFYEGL